MTGRLAVRLILLVSAAHALVHVFEISLPSVEQNIAIDFEVGKETTGLMGTCWRLPWGFGALIAGWLVDRFGSRRLLAVFLFGCAATCLLSACGYRLSVLFFAMIAMGTFASIYHPAGLALISQVPTPTNRPLALGIHGVFGSLGIGGAPFLAGIILFSGLGWRPYYTLLAVPAVVLGMAFLTRIADDRREREPVMRNGKDHNEFTDWSAFFRLTIVAALYGITYAAVLHFLPRYLGNINGFGPLSQMAGNEKIFASMVLLMGCFGQIFAGIVARPNLLEKQLTAVVVLGTPCLLAMAFVTGPARVFTAGAFSFIHFMNQPIYNSLVARYTPQNRRSLCYGFSFAMGLGIGGLGPSIAGSIPSERLTYMGLAGISAAAALISGSLAIRSVRREP